VRPRAAYHRPAKPIVEKERGEMKAEHRRELNTNALADRMGRLVQGMKEPTQGRSAVLWVIGAVALLTLGGWYLFSGAAGWSGYWLRFDGETNVEKLQTLVSESQGTMPARAARFQKARIELRNGLRNISSAEHRSEAIRLVEEARRGFEELAAECKGNSPLLEQEALWGAAQAEESLVGIPTTEDPTKSRGSLKKAIELYQRMASPPHDEGYFADVAKRRIAELEANPSGIESFYSELNKLATAKKS
jgi:hypothetical protein